MEKNTYWQIKVFGGGILALVVATYLVFNGLGNPNLILTGILGGILGWITGILFSPKDKGEAESFADYRAGIAAFLGGIVIAKTEQYMEPYLKDLTKAPEPLLEYALYFAISFGLGLLITFVGRKSDEMFG